MCSLENGFPLAKPERAGTLLVVSGARAWKALLAMALEGDNGLLDVVEVVLSNQGPGENFDASSADRFLLSPMELETIQSWEKGRK